MWSFNLFHFTFNFTVGYPASSSGQSDYYGGKSDKSYSSESEVGAGKSCPGFHVVNQVSWLLG